MKGFLTTLNSNRKEHLRKSKKRIASVKKDYYRSKSPFCLECAYVVASNDFICYWQCVLRRRARICTTRSGSLFSALLFFFSSLFVELHFMLFRIFHGRSIMANTRILFQTGIILEWLYFIQAYLFRLSIQSFHFFLLYRFIWMEILL